jgi:hypothetical protein
MEKNMEKTENKDTMDRRKALIKTGKYAAFTATAMMIVMSPLKSSAGNVPSGRAVPTRLPKRR